MALSKIQAESMNLADTYAFSGTVSGTSVAGSAAFSARFSANGWSTVAAAGILPYNDVSTGDSFDTDSVYNTSTYKFTAPSNGVYMFWYSIYTANTDTLNAFGFLKNSTRVDMNVDPNDKHFSLVSGTTDDHQQQATVILPLTSGDTIAHCGTSASDYYKGYSQWGGCRLA